MDKSLLDKAVAELEVAVVNGEVKNICELTATIMDMRDAEVAEIAKVIAFVELDIRDRVGELLDQVATLKLKSEKTAKRYDKIIAESESESALKAIVSNNKETISFFGIEVQYVRPTIKVNMDKFAGFVLAVPSASGLLDESQNSPRFCDKRSEYNKKNQKKQEEEGI